jgi:hypothetical protein
VSPGSKSQPGSCPSRRAGGRGADAVSWRQTILPGRRRRRPFCGLHFRGGMSRHVPVSGPRRPRVGRAAGRAGRGRVRRTRRRSGPWLALRRSRCSPPDSGERVAVYDGSLPIRPPRTAVPPGPQAGRLVSSHGRRRTRAVCIIRPRWVSGRPPGAGGGGVLSPGGDERERPLRAMAADPRRAASSYNVPTSQRGAGPFAQHRASTGGHGASSFPGWVLRARDRTTAARWRVAEVEAHPSDARAHPRRQDPLRHPTLRTLGRWGRGALAQWICARGDPPYLVAWTPRQHGHQDAEVPVFFFFFAPARTP